MSLKEFNADDGSAQDLFGHAAQAETADAED